MDILLIGGYNDGKHVSTSLAVLQMPIILDDSLCPYVKGKEIPILEKVRFEAYTREMIHVNKRASYVYRHQSLTVEQCFERLIHGYRHERP